MLRQAVPASCLCSGGHRHVDLGGIGMWIERCLLLFDHKQKIRSTYLSNPGADFNQIDHHLRRSRQIRNKQPGPDEHPHHCTSSRRIYEELINKNMALWSGTGSCRVEKDLWRISGGSFCAIGRHTMSSVARANILCGVVHSLLSTVRL